MPTTVVAPRLLIVEGDRPLGFLFEEALHEMGYACSVVASPEQALRVLHRQPIDVIVTNSFTYTAENVLASPRRLLQLSHPLPVILCTARSLTATEVQQMGFAALVPKPFELDELVTTVAECLHRPFSPTQRRQAAVVQRFLAAASTWDIDTLSALVTEDV